MCYPKNTCLVYVMLKYLSSMADFMVSLSRTLECPSVMTTTWFNTSPLSPLLPEMDSYKLIWLIRI